MPSVRLDVYIQPRTDRVHCEAIGGPKRSVHIVSGGVSRKKVLEIDGVGAEAIAEFVCSGQL